MAFVKSKLGESLPLVASGKVRELYQVDSKSLLFVASDRISAYDVIMENVSSFVSQRCGRNSLMANHRAFPTRELSSLSLRHIGLSICRKRFQT